MRRLCDRSRLAAELDRADGDVVLLVVDLDGFRVVNNAFGYVAGDAVLDVVADRIAGTLGPLDVAARLGGDEFAVLVPGATVPSGGTVASRLLDALRVPIRVAGRPVVMQASVGVATATRPVAADRLLAEADVALQAAKAHGKAQVRVFDESHEPVIDRLRLGADLGDALEKGAVSPHFQPIVALDSGEITGFEALARWAHPERGLVPPGEFVPLAEQTGLMFELGHSILVAAAEQLAEWQYRYPRRTPLTVSVNLSVSQFHHPELLDRVLDVQRTSGIAPGSLCLEVTETSVVDSQEVVDKLALLRDAGIRLAIDDFGTGYSSFGYLRRLPVDIVKIDRSLVAGIARESEQWALMRAVVQLLRTLGLRSVAEGVEQADQMAHLRSLGCDQAQGWFYARAMPAHEVSALLGADQVALPAD